MRKISHLFTDCQYDTFNGCELLPCHLTTSSILVASDGITQGCSDKLKSTVKPNPNQTCCRLL